MAKATWVSSKFTNSLHWHIRAAKFDPNRSKLAQHAGHSLRPILFSLKTQLGPAGEVRQSRGPTLRLRPFALIRKDVPCFTPAKRAVTAEASRYVSSTKSFGVVGVCTSMRDAVGGR